jgi:outer membrane biosynthesis protein TonB
MPQIERGTDPVLALAAFDALRQWRFEPARLGDQPVAVFFSLTVSFRVRQCY